MGRQPLISCVIAPMLGVGVGVAVCTIVIASAVGAGVGVGPGVAVCTMTCAVGVGCAGPAGTGVAVCTMTCTVAVGSGVGVCTIVSGADGAAVGSLPPPQAATTIAATNETTVSVTIFDSIRPGIDVLLPFLHGLTAPRSRTRDALPNHA